MANILIVDDQESTRNFTQGMLSERGHQVMIANDGAEALQLFEQNPKLYNLIVADVNMPKIDGFEFLKRVKTAHPDIPVIFLTGMNEDVVKVVGKEYKVDAIIKKPFMVEEALKVIEEVIANNR